MRSFTSAAFVVLMSSLAGCANDASALTPDLRDITYIRDERPRPAQCYAYLDPSGDGYKAGLARVDCDAVQHLITKVIGGNEVVK